MMIDLRRLSKLMGMTTSNADGEALNALRMANKLLATEKVNWEQILLGTNYIAPSPEDDVIEKAFKTVYATDLGGFKAFIDSLHFYWTNHKKLTPSQKRALFKAAQRANRSPRR